MATVRKSKQRIKAREAWCPNLDCRALLTGYTPLCDDEPDSIKAGDVTVCGYCGALACFANRDGELRAATPADMEALNPFHRAVIFQAQQFFRAVRRQPEHRRTN